jgi:hypothetical protein
MRKIMGNKPQVSSAIIIHSPLQIPWNDLLYQGQSPGTLMGGLVWFDKIFQAYLFHSLRDGLV